MLELSPEEADIVAAEATAAARVLEGTRKQQALELASEAPSGEVPGELTTALERIISASLQGGRARQLYKAEGERILTRLLLRTPGGQRLQENLDAVNQALHSLGGRRLDDIAVTMRSPGHFTVSLRTEGVGLVLSVGPGGVGVESLTA